MREALDGGRPPDAGRRGDAATGTEGRGEPLESAALLRALLAAAPLGIIFWDPRGRLVSANPRAFEIVGRPFERHADVAELGDLFRLTHPGTDEPYDPAVLTAQRALELDLVLPSGERRNLEVWTAAEGEGPARLVVTAFADITERKRDAALRAGEREILEMVGAGAPLADALNRLAFLIESLTDGLIASIQILDEHGHIRHCAAPNLPEAWNARVDGLIPGPIAGSCGTAAYLKETVIAADVTTDPRWAPYAAEALRYGLRACWSTPIFARDGGVLGTFGLYARTPRAPTPAELALAARASHVSAIAIERQRSEDALRAANEALEARVRERTRELEAALEAVRTSEELRDNLVMMLVHDMRSPLTGIRMCLDLLALTDAPATGEQETVTSALDACTTLMGLIDDVLDVSRLEAGEMPIAFETAQVRALVDEALAALALRGRAVVVDVPRDLHGDLDRPLVRRVLMNLIGNAVRFSPAGTAIDVRARPDDDGLTIEVSDEGVGVPAELRERIFDKFGQVGGARVHSSGLGLAFCKLVVAAHGGAIGVRPGRRGGSTFWFTLPAAHDEAPQNIV